MNSKLTPDGWPLAWPDYEVEIKECRHCHHPSSYHSLCIIEGKTVYRCSTKDCDCVAVIADFRPREGSK